MAQAASYYFKVVLIGNSGTGKTSLVTRFVDGYFDDAGQATIGAAFVTKDIFLEERNVLVKLEIWDTAGQERFRALTPMYYRKAHAAVVSYDITDIGSFDSARGWIDEIRNQGLPDALVAVSANKIDLTQEFSATPSQAVGMKERAISKSTAAAFVDENKVDVFYETSAKMNHQVSELFTDIAVALTNRFEQNEDKQTNELILPPRNTKKDPCCGT